MSGIFEIQAHIKDYSWGSELETSWVAKVAKSIGISANTYAEAWYGDHQNGPSQYQGQALSLAHLYPDRLNFLGKILSIARPLSIQVHPDTSFASTLHASNPTEFKDPYGKEEGAIALSKLELAHSLIELDELAKRLIDYPELANLVGQKTYSSSLEVLKKILSLDKNEIDSTCLKLWARLKNSEANLINKNLNNLEKLYPSGDVGVLILLLMNIIELQPGQAIHTPTGCPHAYLSGELLEIMKPSDNVIRCGLTDKKIDANNFLTALKPQQTPATILPTKSGQFKLGELLIEIITSAKTIFSGNNPKILLSLDASGKLISGGTVVKYKPLSSFLIIRDKTFDIEIDSGRIILFGDN